MSGVVPEADGRFRPIVLGEAVTVISSKALSTIVSLTTRRMVYVPATSATKVGATVPALFSAALLPLGFEKIVQV